MPELVTEKQFKQWLKSKLGSQYERALKVFKNYGQSLSWDVTNVLFHALDKEKVGQVVTMLEKHWDEHLSFQHPELRGQVEILGVNKTKTMFHQICQNVLELQPTKLSEEIKRKATTAKN